MRKSLKYTFSLLGFKFRGPSLKRYLANWSTLDLTWLNIYTIADLFLNELKLGHEQSKSTWLTRNFNISHDISLFFTGLPRDQHSSICIFKYIPIDVVSINYTSYSPIKTGELSLYCGGNVYSLYSVPKTCLFDQYFNGCEFTYKRRDVNEVINLAAHELIV